MTPTGPLVRSRQAARRSLRASSSTAAFAYDPRLAARRGRRDAAALSRKAIVAAPPPRLAPHRRCFAPGGLIYELNVRGFTMRHPDVPEAQRGTVAALAHPAVIAHLKQLASPRSS